MQCQPTLAIAWVPGNLFRHRNADGSGDSYFRGPLGGLANLQDDGSLNTLWLSKRNEWDGIPVDTYGFSQSADEPDQHLDSCVQSKASTST